MKRDIKSFLGATRWSVSNVFLSKVNLKQHELKFVTQPNTPASFYQNEDRFDKYQVYNFVRRMVDFGYIGLLCSSRSSPSLREIVMHAQLPSSSPISFGPDSTIREGFGGEAEYGTSKEFSTRIDYTSLTDQSVSEQTLPTLSPGILLYPFRRKGTNVFHEEASERHKVLIKGESTLGDLTKPEYEEIKTAFEEVVIDVGIGVVLDNDDLLHFEWNHEDQFFEPDPFNAGLVQGK